MNYILDPEDDSVITLTIDGALMPYLKAVHKMAGNGSTIEQFLIKKIKEKTMIEYTTHIAAMIKTTKEKEAIEQINTVKTDLGIDRV